MEGERPWILLGTTYKTWSEQRREEALTEAREHRLAHPGPGEANAGLAWAKVLSLVHGAGVSE